MLHLLALKIARCCEGMAGAPQCCDVLKLFVWEAYMKLVLTLLLAVLACIYRLVLPGLAMRGNVLRNYCWKRFGGFKLLSKVQWGFAVMNGRIARFISTGWPRWC